MSYGSPYLSSPSHLGNTLLAHLIGTEMLHVPFKETTHWFKGVARGDVGWSLGTLATMNPMLDSHLLRLLAVAQETAPRTGRKFPPWLKREDRRAMWWRRGSASW